MSSIDLIIIAVYLIACLIIGFYKVDKINNIREYSLGKSSFTSTPTSDVATISTRMGGEVPELQVIRPSLEDIYLQMIGATE